MKAISDSAQRQSEKKFVEYWTFQRGSEKGEDQQFWNSLLRDVLGVADVEACIKYQVPVPMAGTTKFLDAWIPETRVLIEHKSRGIDLDAPQSGHGGLTPYEQATEYDAARPFDEKARWIVTCNFDEFRIYDRAKPLAPPLTLKLRNLPKEAYRLAFLVNPKEKAIDRELEISVQAGRIVGEIYDALLKQYENKHTGLLTPNGVRDFENVSRVSGEQIRVQTTFDHLAALNRLCVRLVFCLYAEDADIFPKDSLRRLVEAAPLQYLRSQLLRLFQTLDTQIEKRDQYLEPELAVFPYTNGGLFRNAAENDIPPLTEEIRKLLVGASRFDWREITPTIFGALFESTLNPDTRRAGGMVYTSVENIHKVIDPLFLDDLTRRVNEALGTTEQTEGTGKRTSVNSVVKNKLLALQEEMASLAFLDPACGSGNFLTETYICLRRLENRIIAALQQGQRELDLGVSVKVSIAQFHGIEINDFAVSVAKTALWIAEAQMLRETAEILHREPDYLPLKDYDGIVEGNALRMNWGKPDYIIGNPPFRGARHMSDKQKADVLAVFGRDWQGVGDLDYVCCWYRKAVDYMAAQRPCEVPCSQFPVPSFQEARQQLVTSNCPLATKCAFVSTNSICQGGAVANLWKPLFAQGLEIDFAHRTFRWDNEAAEKAHVHCVIIGFHVGNGKHTDLLMPDGVRDPESVGRVSGEQIRVLKAKKIFDDERAIPATHINGYLMDAPDVWVGNRATPLCDVPEIGMGNQPIDDGNYLFTKEEMDAFLKKEPPAAKFFRPWYGADELINGNCRYCLWLGDCPPAELFAMPECLRRVQTVRDYRLASKRTSTKKLADKPTRFQTENFPKGHYIAIPEVSSERRRYVPMGYLSPEVLCSNKLRLMPDATLFHFGVLMSGVHNAWVRAVCGRLKSDYDYSIKIVYNNFPWPEIGNVANVKMVPITSANNQLETGNIGTGNTSTMATISQTAQAILDARAKFSGATLAQMYGDKMFLFPELVAAHEANDRAVLAAYGLAPDTPEPEIVAHLFKLYAEKAK